MKENHKTDKRGLLELLALKGELSPDALAGEPRIELRGKNQLFVGGCRRIITYSPTLIVLAVKGDELSVRGGRLVCSSYYSGAVSIEGAIRSISFGEGEA